MTNDDKAATACVEGFFGRNLEAVSKMKPENKSLLVETLEAGFLAGARWKEEQILALLRSEEVRIFAYTYFATAGCEYPRAWHYADWLESKLKDCQ